MAESPRPVERPSRSSRDRAPRRFWYERHAGGRGLETILLIGSVPFRLDSAAVRKLEQAIREKLVDARGVPLAFNETVWSCIQLANAIAEEREDGSSPEPIEVGWNLVYGLCEHVLSDELVHGDAQLSALYGALLRYEAQGGWTR